MSSSISNVLAIRFDSTGTSSNTPRVQPSSPTNNDSPDTVLLSEAQFVYRSYREGETVAQIASRLGLSEEAVDSYLATAA
jgi:DNA-binding NarL/FixJ family response regulator